MKFFTYPKDPLPDLTSYILLTPDAPLLTQADRDYGVFLIDGTWRYAAVMIKGLKIDKLVRRSLPNTIKTAYPRRQQQENGLASAEALFAAYIILGRDGVGLLDNYYWKDKFLLDNSLTFPR